MSPRELIPRAPVCEATCPGARPAGHADASAPSGHWTSSGTNVYGWADVAVDSINEPTVIVNSIWILIAFTPVARRGKDGASYRGTRSRTRNGAKVAELGGRTLCWLPMAGVESPLGDSPDPARNDRSHWARVKALFLGAMDRPESER